MKKEKENTIRNRLYRAIEAICIVGVLLIATVMPINATISPPTLTATLAPGESIKETKTVDIPALPPKADIIFAFDLTGSMGSIIDTAKANATDIMNNLPAGVDYNFGVMSYMDYPHSYDSYGYASEYGSAYVGCGDYAYALNQSLTADKTAVSNAINALTIGCGSDGPQDYTRIMYESYADPSVGWRTGAKKIIVNFGDNVPHDDNLNEGITGGSWSTGGDPGRDEVMFTADDLNLQTVLSGMASNNVILLESHTADWIAPSGLPVLDYWNNWTATTGGKTFITGSPTMVNDVIINITGLLTSPTIDNLHLVTSPGYEPWLVSVTPTSYSGPTGVTANFDIVITVPSGTADGTYNFAISAVDNNGVNYGDQAVTINVVSPQQTGNVTGGGSITVPAKKSNNGKATFGFVAHYADGATVPTGNLQYIDNAAGLTVHGNVTALSVDTTTMTAKFSGIAKVNGVDGYAYTVIVADNGEPGKNDTFAIDIPAIPYTASGKLTGGNIQIHNP